MDDSRNSFVAALHKAKLQHLSPPPRIGCVDWAEKHFVLSSEDSASPGKFRIGRCAYQREVLNALSDPTKQDIVLQFSSQTGKALSLDTPILTTAGWKTIGTIAVGDYVFDENGKPTIVNYTSPIFYDHDCYEVRFDDDEMIVADENHLWNVDHIDCSKTETLTTKAILDRGLDRPCGTHNKDGSRYVEKTFSIPVCKPVEYPTADLQRKHTKLPSKFEKGRRSNYQQKRKIVSITQVESVPTRCIQVESPTHLFLAGKKLVPTHNTQTELVYLAYIICNDPGPIFYVLPNVNFCEDFSKRRISPMIKNVRPLKALIPESSTRDGNNTILAKHFAGGSLKLAAAGISSQLTSAPVRYVIFDEIDKFESNPSGDPLNLAKQRTQTFSHNRKLVYTSTPENADSKIAALYDNSDQRIYQHRCIHCNEFFSPVWEQVKWITEENEPKPQTALLHCPHCSCGHNDAERQVSVDKGQWLVRQPGRAVTGFFLNALSSPFVKLSDLVEQFTLAQTDVTKLKQFTNEILGLPYEGSGERIDNLPFSDRLEEYTPATIPNEVIYLTAGCDVQQNRIECVVYGWGNDQELWNVDHFIINGAPNDPTTWQQLHSELQQDYIRLDGLKLKIKKTGIDTGGNDQEIGVGFSEITRKFCKLHQQYGYLAVKGASTAQKTIITKNKKVYLVDTFMAKDTLFHWLKNTKPGPGYIHFPTSCTAEFFDQLTSEERKREKMSNGRTKLVYKRIGNKAAEILDCTVYAIAVKYLFSNSYEKSQVYSNDRALLKQITTNETATTTIIEEVINTETTPMPPEPPRKLSMYERLNPGVRRH